ncbi:hypothetical protein FB566_3783 [Stackebrandtia endophytica]|uniref:Uncharacterized protein n=1 Tax=Stackebrandtia endophytica TaxID=1496996 RepID=A0A543B047_9ACTN|nr:DUF6157 family protein [Stackebrandtia endophytica]TQL78201.1 hypothetical protein FB566_3783 [Stackebrandtia endophytica]
MEKVDYTDTFITVSPDSTASTGQVPAERGGKPTVASAMYHLLADNPYRYRSSDVIFDVWADRQDIADDDRPEARAQFYARSRACLRSSDLPKRYGWGIHADSAGFLAVYAVDSDEYRGLVAGTAPDGTAVTVRPGMRSSRR